MKSFLFVILILVLAVTLTADIDNVIKTLICVVAAVVFTILESDANTGSRR